MNNLKEEIIKKLYELYQRETAHMSFACKKGCTACCTQNVTMTATEGEMILNFMVNEDRLEETNNILRQAKTTYIPQSTPNNSCGDQNTADENWDFTPCYFLKENNCSIYPVRPFACRCFFSTSPCSLDQPAEQPEWLASLNWMMIQLIEHVGQGEFWGNMTDILLELSSQGRYIGRDWQGEGIKVDRARFRLLKAEPVREFVVDPLAQRKIELFLQRISKTAINGGTIGSILGM